MCIVLCWSLWCPLVMDMQTTTGIAKPWWEVQHGTQTASCHHIMKNGLRCVQSHTPVPTSSFDMIVNTTLPRHNWHNWTSISSDCGVLYAGGREMSVARFLLTVVEARGVRSGRARSSPSAFTTAAWGFASSSAFGLRAASLRPCIMEQRCASLRKCCDGSCFRLRPSFFRSTKPWSASF